MSSSLFNPSEQASGTKPNTSTWSFSNVPADAVTSSNHDQDNDNDNDNDIHSQCSHDSYVASHHDDTSSLPTSAYDPSSLFDIAPASNDVFSRPSTPQSDYDDDASEAQYARSTRLARAAATKAFVNIGCWIDHDESGNYEPSTEDVTIPTSRRKRPINQVEPRIAGDPKRRKAHSTHTTRLEGIRCEVVIKLPQSLECRLLALSMPHNWPSGKGWNVFTDEPLILETNTDAAYHTRSRRQSTRTNKQDKQDDTTPEDEIDDLTGHPLARGCKGCRKLGVRCPLLEPGARYPCDTCAEDDADCELNVEPLRKQTCERCIQRRRHCSYNDTGSDHSKGCVDCLREGFRCFAGPVQDPTRTRIAADGKPASLPPPKQKNHTKIATTVPGKAPARSNSGRYLKCTECQMTGRRCTLRRRKPEFPCKPCKEHNTSCVLEKPQGTKLQKSASPVSTLPESPRGITFPRAASSKSIIQHVTKAPQQMQITTKLAHPIKFMYDASPSSPCTFCQSPLLALLGYGLRTPTVSVWADGRSCTELKGGHVAAGKPRTQICGGCTLSRLLMCACPGHVMGRIGGKIEELKENDASKDDSNINRSSSKQPLTSNTTQSALAQAARKAENAALKQLTLTAPRSVQRTTSLARWCSLCPALATYTCMTAPAIGTDKLKPEYRHSLPHGGSSTTKFSSGKEKASSTTTEAASADKAGCGFRLCESCMKVFKIKRNDLGMTVKMLQEAVKMTGSEMSWPRGLRADYEFLGNEGWMMIQCRSGWKQ